MPDLPKYLLPLSISACIAAVVLVPLAFVRQMGAEKQWNVRWYPGTFAVVVPPAGSSHMGFTIGWPLAIMALAAFIAMSVFIGALLAYRHKRQARAEVNSHEQALRKAQDALYVGEERWKTALNSIADAVITMDTNGQITYLNPRALILTSWNTREALNQPFQNVLCLLHEETRKPADEILEGVIKGKCVVALASHLILMTRAGREVPIEVSVAPIVGSSEAVLGAVVVLRNISERRRAEEAQQHLSALVEATEDAIIGCALNGIVTSWNFGATRLYGYSAQEMIGHHMSILLPPGDNSGDEDMKRRIKSGESISQYECVRRHKDGSLVDVSLTVSPIFDVAGRRYGISVIARDISERKRAERTKQDLMTALQNEKEKLLALIGSINDEVWVADTNHRFTMLNPAALRSFGLIDRSEKISTEGLDIGECYNGIQIFRPDGTPRPAEEATSLRALRGEIVRSQEEILKNPETGELRYREVSAAPVHDSEGNIIGAVSLARDITERKRTEEALLRSEKLASVGKMAASIAHEVNNPLAAAMNALFLARASIHDPEQLMHYLDMTDDELKQISHITRQTLGFYRESTGPKPVLMDIIVDSAVDLLRAKIRMKNATIRKRCDGHLQVLAVQGELRQVISNLLANSLDAIENGGVIHLHVSCSTWQGQKRARVTVADDGKGIDPAILPRIFEPLFTTKEATGSGLGLWVSKQIVEKHKGVIRMRSSAAAAKHGSVFSVLLPASTDMPEAPPLPPLGPNIPSA